MCKKVLSIELRVNEFISYDRVPLYKKVDADLRAEFKFYFCSQTIIMKSLLTGFFFFCLFALSAQTVPAQRPVEERYAISYWWWVLGVILAIGAGILIYMLIKKDPKRDAIR